ncbi:MAG: SPFH domain-containing protein [Clostridiales bacterium]|nr:SPFH domain-containing protein [Clostridiales bacterium]
MAHITDIIKYEGDNSTFIWKHPKEDFNTLTQLIVHESQEAIFMMNGEALDLFGPGRHTLETQNIPKLGKYIDATTRGNTPFHCEVYYINKAVQMGIKWGTDSKVRYIDPDSGLPLELGASGEMNLQVADSRKLLLKLVGTMKGIAWDTQGKDFAKSLQNSFRPLISTAVKSNLTTAIKQNNINILEVDEHLTELSQTLKDAICPGFEEYGLTIPQFYMTSVVLPDDDPNFRRVRELYTVGLQKRVAQAEAEVKSAQIQAEAEVRKTKAQTEAEVTATQRIAELEKQTTETEILKREAERKIIASQAEAQVRAIEASGEAEAIRAEGIAEADVMRAKGYSEKDVIQADVQKAYAEGLGQFGSNAGGGGGGGSTMSDIMGIGIGLQAAGAMGKQIGNMFEGMNPAGQTAPSTTNNIQCPSCGNTLPANAKFCLECGTKIVSPAADEIICPSCGAKTPKGKFCLECGAPMIRKCANCGAEIPAGGKFCLECGTKV